MLIPSIDLLDGKVVQLVQGEKKALEFESAEPWIEKFSRFPTVQVIDLDAAMRTGKDNRKLIEQLCTRLRCQVGGGIRNPARAKELLGVGARRVIIGSSLFPAGTIDVDLARDFSSECPLESLIFSVDSRNGKVATHGWKQSTALTPEEGIRTLDPYCGGFLYTHIETEGTMRGLPFEVVQSLKELTQKRFIAAGGIKSMDEVNRLDRLGIDAVVGMAIYTDAIPLSQGIS